MRVSLIMATIRRTLELEKFLYHLARQTYRDFELIVVDQNEDNRIVPILQLYENQIPIVHIRSEKGISKSRNKGLTYVTGDLVSFPDDDCWYDPNVLEKVVQYFQVRPELDIVTGRSIDEWGNDAASKFDRTEGVVDKLNVWRRAISFTIFHKKSIGIQVGGFDEEIGVGADSIYLSGEETDYVLRALPNCQVYYFPELTVNHPSPITQYSTQVIERAYKYGCGFGKVVTKHRYSLKFKAVALFKPFAAMLLYSTAFQFPRSNYYWHSFKGRLRGMR
jgi:glycosyltransferase involved in cell wall biosynthesis